MTPEDEAFEEIERKSLWRKEQILQALHDENKRLGLYDEVYGIPAPQSVDITYRNQVLEEVAQAIERMESFGKDTISSFAIYIRSMKE